MRTTPIGNVLLRAWAKVGNDGSAVENISPEQMAMLVESANLRIRQCWEFTDWPDLCRVERRAVQGDAETGRFVDPEQPPVMGAVLGVWRDNPLTQARPRLVPYRLLDSKVRLPTWAPDEVWIQWRKPAPIYTATEMTAEVPMVLAQAAVCYIASDLQEEDGQFDKALVLERHAEDCLVREQDKFLFQENQPRRWPAAGQ